MENLMEVPIGFKELSGDEILKIYAQGLETAMVGAAGGAMIGGVTGFGVGTKLTPVMGPPAIPVCIGGGIVGGACVGFVEGW